MVVIILRQKLEQLRDRLYDLTLSGSNKSLRLLRLTNDFIDITAFDVVKQVKSIRSSQILDHLVKRQSTQSLKLPLSSYSNGTYLLKQITEIYRKIAKIQRETGEKHLFLGFPFISGTLQNKNFIHAPLVFYPVRFVKEGGDWSIAIEEEAVPFFNRTLILAMDKYNETRINEEIFHEVNQLSKPLQCKSYIDLLDKYGIKVDVQDPFELRGFQEYKKEDIDEKDHPLTLTFEAVIGCFVQGKKGLYRDYQDILKELDEGKSLGLLQYLLLDERTVEDEILDISANIDDHPEEKNFFLMPTDSSQEEALLTIRRSRGLVVDGPPGTGKSQVIINLIADALQRKEKVLVVCEKKAALNVVYQRLAQLDLDQHVALVHNEQEDRRNVYDKIGRLVEEPFQVQVEDAKNTFINLSRKISETTAYLNSVASTMWTCQPCGLTLFKLYDKSLSYRKQEKNFKVGSIPDRMTYDQLLALQEPIMKISRYNAKFSHEAYPWVSRKDFGNFLPGQKERIEQCLESILDQSKKVELIAKDLSGLSIPIEAIVNLDKAISRGLYFIQMASQKRLFSKLLLLIWMKIQRHFLNQLGYKVVSENEWSRLSHDLNQLNQFQKEILSLFQNLRLLEEFMEKGYLEKLKQRLMNGNSIVDWVEELLVTIKRDFDVIVQADREYQRLSKEAKEVYRICCNHEPPKPVENLGEIWWEGIEKAFLERWIQLAENENPGVIDLSTNEYQVAVQRYSNQINQKRAASAEYLRLRMLQMASNLDYPETIKRKISHETLYKKSKQWPIRKLLSEFPDLIHSVITVWLVSPETASTIFPLSEGLFDLVIFDEASQCPVENGIPALFRAKKIVIAGDDKQLKPSKVCKVAGLTYEEEDEGYIEELEDAESLLDLAAQSFKRKRLKWHYRSEFEELINFSNHAFYKDIQVAPNVQPFADPPSISWIAVDGEWVDKSNMREAQKIVEIIVGQLKGGIKKTLGVVTFNQEQAKLIEVLIEQETKKDPEFNSLYQTLMGKSEDERLTIKNIENIQGEERDIMIFCIAYARNRDGNIVHQFGSLSRDGGENRLNVAITRAKSQIIIVCSIHPSELAINEQNRGPYFFKRYLEYAYFVAHGEYQNAKAVLKRMNQDMQFDEHTGQLLFDSTFEEEVYNALGKLGYTVNTQVGASQYRVDLGIVHPDIQKRYILGVECDGATYHSSKSARERDVTRQEFLESRGWKIERIWSRNWWKNPDAEVRRIEKRIKEELKNIT